jgi:hypothetical protein
MVLLNVAADVLPLFLFLFALAAASRLLGLPHWAYFAVNGVLFLFLLPGWLLARRWPSSARDGATRYYHASVIAFALYAASALVCHGLGLSFDAFYCIYAVIILAALLVSLPAYRRGKPRDFLPGWRAAPVAAIALVAAFAICVYRIPWSNDVGQYLLQQQDMARSRTFAPSAIGMTAFGIPEPMPRYRTHLFHVLFSLLADATGLPVEAMMYQWATIPMALFAFAAMFFFVRIVVGPRPPSWTILAAILGPLTVFWREHSANYYTFRFTNNLCLDKDFALFFVLPSMLYLCSRILAGHGLEENFSREPERELGGSGPVEEGGSREPERELGGSGPPKRLPGAEAALLAAYAILALRFHPMTPVYFAMSLPALAACFWPTAGRRNMLLVACYAVALLAITLAAGSAQAYHHQIDELARIDMARSQSGRPLHYWSGHYASIPGWETNTIVWNAAWMRLREEVFLRNSLIVYSLVLTGVWAVILAFQRRARRYVSAEEYRSFRMQAAYLAVLASIWLCSPIVLGLAPHLYRGYERLHWFYFGFFSIVYVLAHLQCGTVALARRWLLAADVRQPESRGGQAARACLLAAAGSLLPLLFWLHIIDQTIAIRQGRDACVSRIPHAHSFFEIYSPDGVKSLTADAERRLRDVGAVSARPAYLRDEDRVLPFTGVPSRSWFWLERQAIWWREPYGEAFAYAVYGDDFLRQYEAFYDGADRRLSPRLLQWIVDRDVSVVVFVDGEEFVLAIGHALGVQVTELEPHVWRLERRVSRDHP